MKGPSVKDTKPTGDSHRSGTKRGRRQSEEALRKSEGKLNAILLSIPDHISMMDEELNIIWANGRAREIFGNDIVGRKCYEVYHRRTEPCVPHPCLVLKTFEDGGIHEHDTSVVDKEGSTIYFHCTANVALRDAADRPVTVLEISRDITESVRAEEALRKEKRFAEGLIETARVIVLLLDPEGRILSFNPYMEELCGYRLEEVQGRDWFSTFLRDKDRDMLRGLFKKALGGFPTQANVNAMHTRDGRILYIEWHDTTLRDDHGGVTGLLSIGSDITSRRKMEEELRIHRDHLGKLVEERTIELRREVERRREKEEQYLSLIESVREWIWQMDANFLHTYLSPRVEEVMGYKPEELLGKSPAEYMPPGEAERVMPLLKDIMLRRVPFVVFENVWLHKDGHPVFIEANGRPFFDRDGNFLGYRGSCRDITERKRFLEALEERERELTAKSLSLEELNAALRALLKQREKDREDLEEKFVSNVNQLVLPYINRVRKSGLDSRLGAYLDIASANLGEILSPFLSRVKQFNFTPKEIEVSSLIKEGRTTREIARLMGVKKSAIDAHRDNIRKKLGLNKKKANLRTYLLSLK